MSIIIIYCSFTCLGQKLKNTFFQAHQIRWDLAVKWKVSHDFSQYIYN